MDSIQYIDAHTHVFADAVVADRGPFLQADATFREMYADPSALVIGSAALVDSMEQAGIAAAIACGFAWTSAALCREGNDAIIHAAQLYPDRIAGFGTVVLSESPADVLQEIDRLAEAGIHGLGELRPDTQGLFDAPDAVVDAFAERLRGHGMGLLLHASEPLGRVYPGKGTATPERLYPLLKHLWGIPAILGHAGGGLPNYAQLLGAEEALANVYVDTAAMPYLYRPAAIRTLINSIGIERVLFATDYPLMPHGRVIEYLEKAELSSAEIERIAWRNARDFLDRIGATNVGQQGPH